MVKDRTSCLQRIPILLRINPDFLPGPPGSWALWPLQICLLADVVTGVALPLGICAGCPFCPGLSVSLAYSCVCSNVLQRPPHIKYCLRPSRFPLLPLILCSLPGFIPFPSPSYHLTYMVGLVLYVNCLSHHPILRPSRAVTWYP